MNALSSRHMVRVKHVIIMSTRDSVCHSTAIVYIGYFMARPVLSIETTPQVHYYRVHPAPTYQTITFLLYARAHQKYRHS